MADKFEQANSAVAEAGYFQTEETLLASTAANTAKPAAADEGEPLRSSTRAILVGFNDTAGQSFSVEAWGYFGATIGWRRIKVLDKAAIDADGDSWKANIGGVERLYARVQSLTGGTAKVYMKRAYT